MASTRTAGDNKHFEGLTSGRYVHAPASATNFPIRTTAGRLLRVILNTNGGLVTIRNGTGALSDVVGIIALDAPEGTFNYGVFCPNGIYVDTGATVDCTVVFSD